jgi:hypothetical protein
MKYLYSFGISNASIWVRGSLLTVIQWPGAARKCKFVMVKPIGVNYSEWGHRLIRFPLCDMSRRGGSFINDGLSDIIAYIGFIHR